MPVTQIGPDEKVHILEMREAGKSVAEICFDTGRAENSIRRLLKKYEPTTILATRLIKASAEKLAQRIIDKADVEQAIDVLSRPNIDVLKPVQVKGSQTGIFVSVNPGSLGGVEVKGQILEGQVSQVTQPKQLTGGQVDGQSVNSGGSREVAQHTEVASQGPIGECGGPGPSAVRPGPGNRDSGGETDGQFGGVRKHTILSQPTQTDVGRDGALDPDRNAAGGGRNEHVGAAASAHVDRPQISLVKHRGVASMPQMRESQPSRHAIKNPRVGKTAKNHGSSDIHLRYDMEELDG